MNGELNSHDKLETWTDLPRSSMPKHIPIMKGRWVLKTLGGLQNEILEYKFCWVAKGLNSKWGTTSKERSPRR